MFIQLLYPRRLSFLGSGEKILKVEEIASDTFSVVFLSTVTTGVASQPTLFDVQQAINKLPDGDLKGSLTEEMLNSGVTTMQETHGRLERWYDDMMAGVAALYKQHNRRIVI